MLQAPKGTRDFLFQDQQIFESTLQLLRNTARLYGYRSVSLPIFEHTELFARSLGETSDVVSKEMYTFSDKKGRSLTLRPEFTASIVRALSTNPSLLDSSQEIVRLFTDGPLFRYERPQRGRYRQFYQFDVEVYGSKDSYVDVEIISLASKCMTSLDLDVTLEMNCLGTTAARERYKHEFVRYLQGKTLSEDSQARLLRNPLRILDSKSEEDIEAILHAPSLEDFLEPESRSSFEHVLSQLRALNITYTLNPRLVRGLDYYNEIVFEFLTSELGAQGAVVAGGRYDSLAQQLGGRPTPAMGFAIGIDRVMELRTASAASQEIVSILALSDEALDHAWRIADELRSARIAVSLDKTLNLGKSLRRASHLGTKFVVLVGEQEMRDGKYTLKNMHDATEVRLSTHELLMALSC